MDRTTWWLLDTAAQGGFPLWWLALDPEQQGQAFNREPLGVATADLVDVFMHMQNQGLLNFIGEDKDGQGAMPRRASPTELYAAVQRELQLWYRFTPHGAHTWEQAAQPDWSRFISLDLTSAGTSIIRTGSAERCMLLRTWYQEHVRPIPKMEIITIRPWACTYWKTLQAGYHLSFAGPPAEHFTFDGIVDGIGDYDEVDVLWHKFPAWEKFATWYHPLYPE